MIVAVTGTPGTGKTAVAEALARRTDLALVDINDFVDRDEVETREDPERDATAIDPGTLVEVLRREVPDDAVIDGHLSHHFPADLTVVLRCEPGALRERLAAKGWGEEKVEENVEAEALDLVLQEAVAERDRVAETDTTGREPDAVAEDIRDVMEADGVPAAFRPGRVDWSAALG